MEVKLSDNKPAHTTQRLKRLMANAAFEKLKQKALSDRKNVEAYVAQAKKQFKLRAFWDDILRSIFLGKGDILTHTKGVRLRGAAQIESNWGKPLPGGSFKIVVSPETTQREVVRAFSVIKNRLKDKKLTSKKRISLREDEEFLAVKLRDAGTKYKDIAVAVNKKFNRKYDQYQISDLIRRGRQKLAAN